MRWARRFRFTGHDTVGVMAAGLGVRSVERELEESLRAGVLLAALDLLDDELLDGEVLDVDHPGHGAFKERDVVRALAELRDWAEERRSAAHSGFWWATFMARRGYEEREQLALEAYEAGTIGPRAARARAS